MKRLAKLTMVLVALGFCLPGYGEILVYKITETGTEYHKDGTSGVVKYTAKGYLVIDVDYDSKSITQAEIIWYGKDEEGPWFEQDVVALELVRIAYDTKVDWVITAKVIEFDGEEVVGCNFVTLAGKARNKNIGAEEAKEVASSLTGYSLWDNTEDVVRYIGMSKIKISLYTSWTRWANGDDDDEGNQDFDATKEMIKAYLIKKDYEEVGGE